MSLKRFLISILVLCCLLGTLVACNKTPEDDTPTDAIGESDAQTDVPVDTTGRFSIFMNGEYVCRVVCPDQPSDAEQEIYKKVRERLKSATDVMPERVTDFKAFNDTGEERAKPAILVGKTNYEESKQVYAKLGYGESKIEVVGNKLVIAFTNIADGERILQKFRSIVKSSTEGYVSVDAAVNESVSSNESFVNLPRYPEGEAEAIDAGDGTYTVSVKKSDVDGLREYGDILLSNGYECISTREAEGNVFYTYTNETDYIYTYYSAYDSSVRICGGPIGMLTREDYSLEGEESYTPYLASIPQPFDGEGYFIRLPDGRFIIFDGGYKDGDRVYRNLRKVEEGKITIAAWFISHPHSDHYPAFIDFIAEHAKDEDVVIERVLLNYTNPQLYNIDGTAGKEEAGDDVTRLYNEMQTYIPDVPRLKVHTGQVINFGSANVEILYTIDDHLPDTLNNINDSSLVIRVNVGGQSIMFLADTCYVSGPILNNLWGASLKSDILQMAHHASWPSVKEIYQSIQAEVLLIPAATRNAKLYVVDERWSDVMQIALGYAKDLYVMGEKLQVYELPYTPAGNKAEMLEYLENYVYKK